MLYALNIVKMYAKIHISYRINWFSDFVQCPDSKELEDKNIWKLDPFPSLGEGRHLLCWVP
jgi:hypothetical protein